MPAMWVGWSRGAAKGALLEFVHGVCGRHAREAPLRLDVGGLEPSSSVVIKASEATLRPVSYPAYLAGGWLRCRSARASLAACLQHLVAMASKSAAGGSRARAAQARWACCVSTLWPTVRRACGPPQGTPTALHGSGPKSGADRKSLVKFVDENSMLLPPPQ